MTAMGFEPVVSIRMGKVRRARSLVVNRAMHVVGWSGAPVPVWTEDVLADPHLEATWHTK